MLIYLRPNSLNNHSKKALPRHGISSHMSMNYIV